MKRIFWATILLLLTACTPPPASPQTIKIIDGENIIFQPSNSRVPVEILREAGVSLNPADRLFLNGEFIDPNTPLDCESCTLQTRRAVKMTLITDEGEDEIITAALTVGDALAELGIHPYTADFLDPSVGTPATDQLRIIYHPARELAIHVDGQILHIRSSAGTVGEALLEGGIPLVGLDASQPSTREPLPADGQIQIIRVVEEIELTQKSIPFEVEYVASNDVEIDQEEIITPGVTGLIVSRARVRYEDGVEVSRNVEGEETVRQPSTQVVAYGTKYVLHTVTVDGQTIQYWRAIPVYATSYSPCAAGEPCYPNTSSGKTVQHGVIAVIRSWYYEMKGMRVYIPGYGYATIEDVGGGIPGKDWIDLGYTDADYQPWHQWVTMYFLP